LAIGENSYSGTFSIDQYDTQGSIFLVHITGMITAQRITFD